MTLLLAVGLASKNFVQVTLVRVTCTLHRGAKKESQELFFGGVRLIFGDLWLHLETGVANWMSRA